TPPLPPPAPTVRPTVVVRFRPPPVPVTVIVAAPSVAVVDTDKVRTLLLPVAGFGLRSEERPAGNELALKVTPPGKQPVGVTAIGRVPLAPRLIVRLVWEADNEKSGVCTSFTVRPIDALRVRPPPVPVTVIVIAPSAAVLDAERVRTLLLPVAGFTL